MKHDPALEQWPLTHINPVGASLMAMRHHLTSDSLLEHRRRSVQHPSLHPFYSSASYGPTSCRRRGDRVAADSIQGLHASSSVLLSFRSSLQKYEQGGMPADPSRESVDSPKLLSKTRGRFADLPGRRNQAPAPAERSRRIVWRKGAGKLTPQRSEMQGLSNFING